MTDPSFQTRPSLGGRFFHFVVKAVFLLSALTLALMLLLVGLVALIFSLLKAALTGKKPAPWAAFERYRQFTAQRGWQQGAGPGGAASSTSSPRRPLMDVTDVEVREVREPRSSSDPH